MKKDNFNKYVPPEKTENSNELENLKTKEKKDNIKFKPDGQKQYGPIIVKILLITSIISLIVYSVFSFIFKYNHVEIDKNDIGIEEEQLVNTDDLDKIINIALLGVDKNNVSDSIMILSINREAKVIKLISILRDSLVMIYPKSKKTYFTKINEAYGNGGEITTLRTINKNYNITKYTVITANISHKVINLKILLSKWPLLTVSVSFYS